MLKQEVEPKWSLPMLSNLWKSQQSKSLQVIPESWMLKR